MQYRATGTH